MSRKIIRLVCALLIGMGAAGCSNVNDRNQLAVYVCDSPADYSGVTFYISRVEVRTAGTDTWTFMGPTESYVSLMDLINGKMQEVARSAMEGGTSYDAVRISFSPQDAFVRIEGENLGMELDPDDAVTTTVFPVVTMDGPNRPLLFDIDIAASVIPDANTAHGYRFRPQVSYVDLEECGVVQGGLQAGQSAVTGRIWMRFTDNVTGKATSTYCSVNPAGAFFVRLMPGTYTLDVFPSEKMQLENYTGTVTVERQKITDLGIVILRSRLPQQ